MPAVHGLAEPTAPTRRPFRRQHGAALRPSQATHHPNFPTHPPFSPARRVPFTRAPLELFRAWLKLTDGRVIS